MPRQGREIVLIGHAGHPEIEGTMGRIDGKVHLISTAAEESRDLQVSDPAKLAYITQTTLSVDDTQGGDRRAARALSRRSSAPTPRTSATPPRTASAPRASWRMAVDVVLVVGAANSSNSNRLREIAAEQGVPAYLIADADALDPDWLDGARLGRHHRRRLGAGGTGAGAHRPAARARRRSSWRRCRASPRTSASACPRELAEA